VYQETSSDLKHAEILIQFITWNLRLPRESSNSLFVRAKVIHITSTMVSQTIHTR